MAVVWNSPGFAAPAFLGVCKPPGPCAFGPAIFRLFPDGPAAGPMHPAAPLPSGRLDTASSGASVLGIPLTWKPPPPGTGAVCPPFEPLTEGPATFSTLETPLPSGRVCASHPSSPSAGASHHGHAASSLSLSLCLSCAPFVLVFLCDLPFPSASSRGLGGFAHTPSHALAPSVSGRPLVWNPGACAVFGAFIFAPPVLEDLRISILTLSPPGSPSSTSLLFLELGCLLRFPPLSQPQAGPSVCGVSDFLCPGITSFTQIHGLLRS